MLTAAAALATVATALVPALPARAAQPSSGTPVRGVLERLVSEDAGSAMPTTWVRTDGERVPIEASGVRRVPTGSTVSVTLAPATGDVGATSRTPSTPRARRVTAVDVLARADATSQVSATATAPAAHGVTVVLALPAGAKADGTTTAGLSRLVNGGVAGYWSTQSDGRFSIRVSKVVGWTRVSATCSDVWSIWDEVRVRVRFVPGPRRHLLVYVPSAAGCPTGLATVGASADAGGYAIVGGTTTGLLAHELGHNLGLGHSDSLWCSAASDSVWSGRSFGTACRHVGYGDWYDVMGISWENLGSLSTAHAYRLGLLVGSAVVTARGPARVTLRPVSTRTGVRSLRVQDPSGETYVVEYRPAKGADAWLDTDADWRGLHPGVLVRRIDPDDATQTLLLDPTPTTSGAEDVDVVLGAGRSIATASGRVSVTVESVTADAVTVTVAVDGVSPVFVVEPGGRLIEGRQVTIGQALAAWGATAS
jgi:hypothetical protein